MGKTTFGDKLLATRKLCGMSRRDVANRTGFTVRSLVRWELEGVVPHPLHKRIVEEAMTASIMEAVERKGIV